MKYRRLLLGGFLAMGLAVTTASGALAEQIVAVNSPVESVGGQATKVTDAGLLQNQIRHPSPRQLPVSAFISANVRAS